MGSSEVKVFSYGKFGKKMNKTVNIKNENVWKSEKLRQNWKPKADLYDPREKIKTNAVCFSHVS